MNETWFLMLLARRRSTSDGSDTGTDEGSVYRCRARLLTVTTVEAATAVVARSASRSGVDLAPVIEAWNARTVNPVTRATSRGHGRDLIARAAETVPTLVGRIAPVPLPVAAGMVAAGAGLDAETLARIIGYDDVQQSLVGTPPAAAHVWTQTLLPDIKAMAAQVAHLTEPTRIPATGAALNVVFATR